MSLCKTLSPFTMIITNHFDLKVSKWSSFGFHPLEHRALEWLGWKGPPRSSSPTSHIRNRWTFPYSRWSFSMWPHSLMSSASLLRVQSIPVSKSPTKMLNGTCPSPDPWGALLKAWKPLGTQKELPDCELALMWNKAMRQTKCTEMQQQISEILTSYQNHLVPSAGHWEVFRFVLDPQ